MEALSLALIIVALILGIVILANTRGKGLEGYAIVVLALAFLVPLLL